MILLLDCLTTLSQEKFYGAFSIIFIYDALPVITSYWVFFSICIFSLGDEGGVDWEELDRRVRTTVSDAEIIIPNTYRPIYCYFVFAIMPFLLLWEFILPPTAERVKPSTIFQQEYVHIESTYYAPHTLFCMYTCIFLSLIMYQYSEEDIVHWDPKQEWKHSYLYNIKNQTGEWILFFIFFLYPIYFFTYPLVEHTHTAYLFYFIIIFWAPFYSYFSYLPDEFEMVNPEVQPSGEVLDVPKWYRVRRSMARTTREYFKLPTMRLKEGYTFEGYTKSLGDEDEYIPTYDGGDLFTWPRYIILFIITTPVAFLMLYFV